MGGERRCPQQQLFVPLCIPHHTRTTWSCSARDGNAGCECAGQMAARKGRHGSSLSPTDSPELLVYTWVALREVPKVSASCREDPDKPPGGRPVLEMMKQNIFGRGRGLQG